MKNVIQKSKHGGVRPGAGRKKHPSDWKGQVVTVRLNAVLLAELDEEVKRTGKTRSSLIQQAVYKNYHFMAEFTS